MREHQRESELERNQQYNLDGISFLVESVFKEAGEQTLGTALLRLMQSEAERIPS